MAEKDNWDKFEIVVKTVVLGIIPIVIGFGADNISQSLKTGELVRSLIEDLTKPNTKRDVALIALDAAIQQNKKCSVLWFWGCQPDLEQDQVLGIAMVLVSNSIDDALKKGQSPEELKVARQIITRRSSAKFYDDNFGKRSQGLAGKAHQTAISDVESNKKLPASEIARKENISETLAAIQPSPAKPTDESLAGIRLVYIQYKSNKELAEKLQKELQSKGVSAPGIEKVEEIKQNDIRYASATDKHIAENLKAYLEKNQGIKMSLIDLSANYRVPSGQVEIWIK